MLNSYKSQEYHIDRIDPTFNFIKQKYSLTPTFIIYITPILSTQACKKIYKTH